MLSQILLFAKRSGFYGLRFILIAVLLGMSFPAIASGTLDRVDKLQIVHKTYVITGASSGIGRGIAVKLGSYHANVVLAARRADLLKEVALQVEKAGGKALAVPTDVSSIEDMNHLKKLAVQQFGKIDVWINNAGVGVIGAFLKPPAEDYSRLIDINLKGVVYGSQLTLQQFSQQGYGTLINISSIDGEIPLAYQAVYSSTKAAVLSLGQSLRQELRLARQGGTIRISTIMPGPVDTPWWRHAANYSGGTPRMGGMDPPRKIVDAVVRASIHPKNKILVSWKTKLPYASHRLFPTLTERMSANVIHHYQVTTAPPAPATQGTLYEPMQAGRTIDDDVRARIQRENFLRLQSK